MIVIDVTKAYKEVSFPVASFRGIAAFVCMKEKIRKADLSFVIVDDKTIRSINKRFLQHNYVTDVITFPLEQKGVNAEIYINAQQMKRQANENGVTMKNEMTRLIVHGTLHAIGYQDTSTATKRKMDSIQERYVSELSLN
ncbi:MAG: rRNA maturation RNase YbeY [Bacteroidota bacterium]